MTFECTLNVTGIPPEVSHRAFISSYKQTSNPKYLKKNERQIANFFQQKISNNISQNQIPEDLNDSFFIDFKSDGIYFSSSSKKALHYEFGSKNTPPKRFIEPAFIEAANEVSDILITDAIDLYNKNTRFI